MMQHPQHAQQQQLFAPFAYPAMDMPVAYTAHGPYPAMGMKRDFSDYAAGGPIGYAQYAQPAPLIPADPAPGRAWRCLDATHPPDCASCKEPPRVQREGCFELTGGGVSSKEGEKRLRNLISECPEWKDALERERFAQQFCDFDPRLAVFAHALRRKAVSALAKGHMLQFCRHYGYKTDVWAPRGPRVKRAPLPPPPNTPPKPEDQAQPCCPVPTLSGQSTDAPISSSNGASPALPLLDKLRASLPSCDACAQAASGSQSLAAIQAGGPAGRFASPAVAEAAARYQSSCLLAAKVWRSLIDYVFDRISRVEWVACSDEPAYLVCLGKAYPAKKMLDTLNEDLLALTSAVSAFGAAHQGDPDPVCRAWTQELATYCTLSLQISARCSSVVAESQLGTLNSCLTTYVTSLEVLVAWAERSAAGWAARCQWVAALSSAKGGPASGQFAAQPHLLFPPPAAAAALPAYLAPPPLAFNWERFERQTVLMREQIERFLDGGAEPLMPGWLDLPDGIGLIDTLPERIEHGIHYTGPAIDINIM